jgi:hypothetical protein
MTGIPQVYRTTGKCPASHLVSRFYRIGYNALDDCGYRRLVLLVQLRLNSRFTPFQGKRSGSELRLYSIIKVRLQLPRFRIAQKEGKFILKTNLYLHNFLSQA